MLELVTEIFSPEAQLSPEQAELGRWAAAVRDNNWDRLRQMGHDLQVEPEILFANIAVWPAHSLNRPCWSPWVLHVAPKTFQLRVYAKRWATGCWVRRCEV